MSRSRAPRLLVAVADPALEARLLRHLAPLAGSLWTLASWPGAERLDCVVTDNPAALDLTSLSPAHVADWRPAILALGAGHPADARLPPTPRARETRLACRLLTRVARLQRRTSRHAQRHRQMAHLAATDPLTGLPNRRAWDRELRRRLREAPADAGERRLCLAILDLDHFKRLNDTAGHAAGDAALRAAAESLLGGIRQTDFVARLGGDEFGLLAEVAEASAAAHLVERVRRSMQSATADGPITASAGFALAGALNEPHAIFAAADLALRQAKDAGRDRSRGA